MPYELGDTLIHAGRYRCLGCGDVMEWVTGDLFADWCYICDDPDVRWQLIKVFPHISDPELPAWATCDQPPESLDEQGR